ncbi:MAG: phosphoenolpyruvate--protein phosphotransferase [Bdellovibrionaceae bacterium]|nr:phosphoenolpyruvate--protein phosphotransferase [Pseudobdellovibrionaceae bacterium]
MISSTTAKKFYKGIVVSKGIAKGPLFFKKELNIEENWSRRGSLAEEQEIYNKAVELTRNDLNCLIQKIDASQSDGKEVLDAHIQLLENPDVQDQVFNSLESGSSAWEAYGNVVQEFKALFSHLEDKYIKQRERDLDDVSKRVLFYILNPDQTYENISLAQPSILVCDDLSPSQLLSLDRSQVLGIVLRQGNMQSHTSILCRSLEIPCLIRTQIEDPEMETIGFLDSLSGILYLDPDPQTEAQLEIKRTQYVHDLKLLQAFQKMPTKTKSGRLVPLGANISGPRDVDSVIKNGAELVGLYRTEFLFLDRTQEPPEEEQFAVYKKVFESLPGKKIVLRTLDIGGDKMISYLDLPKEENPFLGVRGIRLCLKFKDLFKIQLRAILRASAFATDLAIMFPMVSTIEEIIESKKLLSETKSELTKEGISFNSKIALGVMMEVPSLAFMLKEISQEVSFISIGTNDLFQYSNACDRMNTDLGSISSPTHPGFLRFLEFIIKESKNYGLHVGVCGSIAHHPQIMPFLIQCGVDDLSMTAQHILEARKSISLITESAT